MNPLVNSPNRLSRRNLVAGGGALGLFAVAARLLTDEARPAAIPAQRSNPSPDAKGYRLTDHVKRYYHTTLF
jgi:hypothetical protein